MHAQEGSYPAGQQLPKMVSSGNQNCGMPSACQHPATLPCKGRSCTPYCCSATHHTQGSAYPGTTQDRSSHASDPTQTPRSPQTHASSLQHSMQTASAPWQHTTLHAQNTEPGFASCDTTAQLTATAACADTLVLMTVHYQKQHPTVGLRQ
jgi:hypothetical protein